jgi:ABC-type transporter Mla maintaining outer membrane lipid asymmetry ATPase subunit MlaF
VTAVLQISEVQRNYQSLRPLRMGALTIAPGERVAISGLDAGAAEVLVNLVTGRSLPDQGEVRVMGQATAEIANADQWFASLDRFGIVSSRAVLVDQYTIEQNIAMVFSLSIDPVSAETAGRVRQLAAECGIPDVTAVTGTTPPEIRARVQLARAVALEPVLLILEHPTAGIPEGARESLAKDFASVTTARRLAALVITQDDTFAKIAADRVLRLDGATGVLKPVRRGWFSR